jgi:hypothetical protein
LAAPAATARFRRARPLTSDIVVAGLGLDQPAGNREQRTREQRPEGSFVARFDGSPVLHQSTYFGGTADDQIHAIAIHPINGRI